MNAEISELIHATLIKVDQLGVLVLGKSGCGKSALALALIDGSGRGIGKTDMITKLVSDDQVCLWQDLATNKIYGRAPTTIAGLLEIRGVGIVSMAYVSRCPVDLVVRIRPENEIERLPEFPKTHMDILGQGIPVVYISTHDITAAAKVRASVNILLHSNIVENDSIIS